MTIKQIEIARIALYYFGPPTRLKPVYYRPCLFQTFLEILQHEVPLNLGFKLIFVLGCPSD